MKEQKMIDGSAALNQKEYKVITINAREQAQDIKLRVAAYARVSSSSDDQLNSFAAQNRYYETMISANENWTLVDVYADEGITGTSAKKRPDFQRLLSDCRRGKIDRVLVKSLSRFARNTKECLEIVRELKGIGVSVCFEKESIDTGKVSGELMTALFASLAQAESESISGNMRWSYQKRMESGKFNTCKAPFGFKLKDGELEAEETQAQLIRVIFEKYLSGESCSAIAEYMTELGIPTRDGKPYWQETTINYILRNERYAGNALLQKKYSTDSLPYEKKRNLGERDQYYLRGSNPPIVDEKVFDAAKRLLSKRRRRIVVSNSTEPQFVRRIICNCCGSTFKKKNNRGKIYWVCRTHDDKIERCPMKQVPQESIFKAFLILYYKLKHSGDRVLPQMLSKLQTVRSQRMLWSLDIIELNKRISDLYSQNQMLAELNKQGIIDPDILIAQTNELAEQLRAAKLEKERLMDSENDEIITQTQELIETIDAGPEFLETFDEKLFVELVDKIIVESNERIRFRLRNGLELTETIERTVR